MSFFLAPIVFLLGIPAAAGVLLLAVKAHRIFKGWFAGMGAFIATLVFVGLMVLPFSAPGWTLGFNGWMVVAGWYLVLLVVGGRNVYRLIQVVKILFDGDPANDGVLDQLIGGAAARKGIQAAQAAQRQNAGK